MFRPELHDFLEPTPPAHPSRQFPGGDIGEREVEKAFSVYANLASGSPDEQINKLIAMRRLEIGSDVRGEYGDLNFLTDAWGNTYTPGEDLGKNIAFTGLFSTLAFTKRTRLLPTEFNDFSEELWSMSSYDRDTIQFFGEEAWPLMHRTHEATYDVLGSWTRNLVDVFNVEDDSSRALLESAAAVPYVLASTTRMEGYAESMHTRFEYLLILEAKHHET